MSSSPPLLNAAEEALLGSAIEKRMKVQALMAGPVSTIIGNRLVDHTRQASAPLYWVGGSRSWDLLVRQSHAPLLTPFETLSVIPGNWDVFFVGRDKSETKKIAASMCTFAKGLLAELQSAMGDSYKWTMETRGFKKGGCEPKVAMDVMGESFPGYGVLLYVEGPEGRDQGGQGVLALYLEVFCFDNVDVGLFKRTYLQHSFNGLTYLNFQGVFLFHHMIREASRRNEKGYDVDMHRRNVLMKLAKTRAAWNAMYIECAQQYRAVWSGFGPSVFDPAFEAQLYINALDVHAAREDFERRIIEVWRPAINACIVQIDAALRPRVNIDNGEETFVMITGGDAMRRFDPSHSIQNVGSKDIDAKVYYKPGTGPSVHCTVAELMSKLTYQAIVHKHATFEVMGNAKGQTSATLGPNVTVEYLTPDPRDSNLQFRLRYIERSEDFPVDLYSIDYRAILSATINSQTFHVPLDIPILDVAVQENTQGLKRADVVRLFDGVPVANERFLFEDLKAMYENKMLARARLLGAKRDKDRARFRALRTFMSAARGDIQPSGLNATDPEIMSSVANEKEATKYFGLFRALVKPRHTTRNPMTRHEMPFEIQRFPWPAVLAIPAIPAVPAIPAMPAKQTKPTKQTKQTKPTKPTKPIETEAKPKPKPKASKRRLTTSSASPSWDPSSSEGAVRPRVKRTRALRHPGVAGPSGPSNPSDQVQPRQTRKQTKAAVKGLPKVAVKGLPAVIPEVVPKGVPKVIPKVAEEVIEVSEVSMAEAAPAHQKARMPSRLIASAALLPSRLVGVRDHLRNLRPQRVVGVVQK